MAAPGAEIYRTPQVVATQTRGGTKRVWWIRALQGATLGAACWMILLALGIPWVLHLPGLDGLLPSMLIGALLGMSHWAMIPWVVAGALSVLTVVIAYTPIVIEPSRSFIRNDPIPSGADAIVVLSAGINFDGSVQPSAVDRLLKGLELLQRGTAPLLVLSREAYRIDGAIVTSRADQERIVGIVPGALSRVIVMGVTHSTHDEAMRTLQLFRDRGWKRIVLVTSPMHTRRACATFEHAGMTVSCVASESREVSLTRITDPEDRIKAFQLWVYELAGSLRYRQLGWI